MKVVARVTHDALPPLPFQARCVTCTWLSGRARHQETANDAAERHVRSTQHTVVIEEEES